MKTRAAPGIIILIITIIIIISIITIITVIIKTVKPGGAAGISRRGAGKGRRGSQRRTKEGLIVIMGMETDTRSGQKSNSLLHSF